MIQFLMVTHGKFADGIKNSIEMLLGKFENLDCLSCYGEENFDLEKEIDRILREYSGREIVVITDIFGGSINNAFMEKIKSTPNLYVISGLNLSLMVEILGEQDEHDSVEKLVTTAIDNSFDAVRYCNLELQKNQRIEDEDF